MKSRNSGGWGECDCQGHWGAGRRRFGRAAGRSDAKNDSRVKNWVVLIFGQFQKEREKWARASKANGSIDAEQEEPGEKELVWRLKSLTRLFLIFGIFLNCFFKGTQKRRYHQGSCRWGGGARWRCDQHVNSQSRSKRANQCRRHPGRVYACQVSLSFFFEAKIKN